jgi:uncharacterized protein HemX
LFLGKDNIKITKYHKRSGIDRYFKDLVFHVDDKYFYLNGTKLSFTTRKSYGQTYDTLDRVIYDEKGKRTGKVVIYAAKDLRPYGYVYIEKNASSDNQKSNMPDSESESIEDLEEETEEEEEEEDIEDLRRENEELKKEIEELKKEIEELKKEISKLKEKVAETSVFIKYVADTGAQKYEKIIRK